MTLEIKYLGHSAFQFGVANINILVDPFLSQNPFYDGDLSEFEPKGTCDDTCECATKNGDATFPNSDVFHERLS